MERRYFPATVMAGSLYLDGAGLAYCTERQVDMILTVGTRRVETAEELEEAVRTAGFPFVRVWILEGLEDVARGRSKG